MSRAKYYCVESGPMNLLSQTLSRCFRDLLFAFAGFVFFRSAFATLSRRTVTRHAGFRGSFAAGPSLVTFAISFRQLSRPAFWLSRGFYRKSPFTTLYVRVYGAAQMDPPPF